MLVDLFRVIYTGRKKVTNFDAEIARHRLVCAGSIKKLD